MNAIQKTNVQKLSKVVACCIYATKYVMRISVSFDLMEYVNNIFTYAHIIICCTYVRSVYVKMTNFLLILTFVRQIRQYH